MTSGLACGGLLVHSPLKGSHSLSGCSLAPYAHPQSHPNTHSHPRWWRTCTFVLWGARLPERPTPPPPPAAGIPQALVAIAQCKHCVQPVVPDDVAGICQDCWEEIAQENFNCLALPTCRYLDYVLKQIKLKLKAKTKMTRIPLGPFSLESLKQLRKYILDTYDYEAMQSEIELVQTKGQMGGGGKKQWELRFSEPEAMEVVFGPAFLDGDLDNHLFVGGAGRLFGDHVFTGWVTGCFRLEASNRRGTTDTSLTFLATAGSISEHGFVWPLGRKQMRRNVYQAYLARQVLRINQSRMKSNAAILVAVQAGATNICSPFTMLPLPFLRRALLEAGITTGAVAATPAPADAG